VSSYRPGKVYDHVPRDAHYSRINPIVDPQLPHEQAGFRQGRSTVDQVTFLTQDIKGSFEGNQKTGVVFVDLTAAYKRPDMQTLEQQLHQRRPS